ncbi:hypothetical protein [Rhizobium terrae]|uniref:hypothetical protein n=1 Tax=Rhizobium terrae TaxID=2171756 RepID=UPI0013C30F69|nr:hypothetical protein [Rhizobium terrae]
MGRSRAFQPNYGLLRMVAGTRPAQIAGEKRKMLALMVLGAVVLAFALEAAIVAFGPEEA